MSPLRFKCFCVLAAIFFANRLLCRYAIAVIDRAVDLQTFRYLVLFLLWGNLLAVPGLIGTSISVSRPRDKFALWYISTLAFSLLSLAIWSTACIHPQTMENSSGPIPLPNMFNVLWLLCLIISLIGFFAVAFVDIAQSTKQQLSDHRQQ